MAGEAPRRQWQSIQYLRGLAALLVVIHHARNRHPSLYSPLERFNAGSHGVDIFFVISGFVMYTAARHERIIAFYGRRLIRVAPLYWLATVLTVEKYCIETGYPIPRFNLIRSLTFMPFANPAFGGQIWPLLVPGWTLNYEMFFYLLFGVALALRRPLMLGWLVIPVLVVLGSILPLPGAAWQTYTSPLLLEFAAGLALGWAALQIDLSPLAALFPLGLIVLLLGDLSSLQPIVLWGGAAGAIVAGALAIERADRLPDWPAARHLGNASYALYLSHQFVLSLIESVWRRPLVGPIQFGMYMGLAITLSVATALVLHQLLERPLLRWLNRLLPESRLGQSAALEAMR